MARTTPPKPQPPELPDDYDEATLADVAAEEGDLNGNPLMPTPEESLEDLANRLAAGLTVTSSTDAPSLSVPMVQLTEAEARVVRWAIEAVVVPAGYHSVTDDATETITEVGLAGIVTTIDEQLGDRP